MYGYHDREQAEAIAKQKTEETGNKHSVVPAEWKDGPAGKFTIAMELKATKGHEFLEMLKARALSNSEK